MSEYSHFKPTLQKRPIQQVRAPWASNANARAQRGLFLAHHQFDVALKEPFQPRPYDDVLMEFFRADKYDDKAVFCITLPREEAPELLKLLAFQGYDGATMFPGLDGAYKSMRERSLWSIDYTDPRTKISKAAYGALVGIRSVT